MALSYITGSPYYFEPEGIDTNPCDCPGELTAFVGEDDTIQFQFLLNPCFTDEPEYTVDFCAPLPSNANPSPWILDNVNIVQPTIGCGYLGFLGQGTATLPVGGPVGSIYQITIQATFPTNPQSALQIIGLDEPISLNSSGIFVFTGVLQQMQLVFSTTEGLNGSFQVRFLSVTRSSSSPNALVVPAGGTTPLSIQITEVLSRNFVTFTWAVGNENLDNFPDCVEIRVFENCTNNDIIYRSEPIRILKGKALTDSCTMLMGGCVQGQALGFDFTNYFPVTRIKATVNEPAYETDRLNYRKTDGRWRTFYADIVKSVKLKTEMQPEHRLDFLALFPAFDSIGVQFPNNLRKIYYPGEQLELNYTEGVDNVAQATLELFPPQNVNRLASNECFNSVPPACILVSPGNNLDNVIQASDDLTCIAVS